MPTGEHRSRRIVLMQPVSEREVQHFAETLGWPRLAEQEQDMGSHTSREIAWGAGPAISLHYTEDPVSLNNYVVTWGTDKDAVEALARLAEENLATWTSNELLEAIQNTHDPLEKAKAVIRAGVGAPDEFDARFFDAISEAITYPDSIVREAGLYATAYSSYPQYRSVLRLAAETDPDEDRRNDARMLLESFDIEGVPEE